MIIVRLEGGLGNQLFQFSHGLALQLRYGGRLIFDRRLIRSDLRGADILAQITDLGQGRYTDALLLAGLRIYAGVSIRLMALLKGKTDEAAHCLSRIGVRYQFNTRYSDINRDSIIPFIYLHGNWMAEKYFRESADFIKSNIHADRALGARCEKLSDAIVSTNSVAVHVRRGDYLSEKWRDKLHVCTQEYYRKAVLLAREKVPDPTFYVFSNSPEDVRWVRENHLFLPEGTVFVDQETSDIEQFALMARCRHFIIANSTFSWWASYLCDNDNKIVIAPSMWNKNVWDMQDIYDPSWQIINVET